MRLGARRWLDRAFRRSPLQAVFRRRSGGRLPVLAYHGVDDPEGFRAQLDYLLRTRRPVSLDEVLDAAAGRRPLPGRPVLITFDDGERSVLEHGLPILRERGVPAAVFVVAGLLDSDCPFWWTEVAHLVAAGGTARACPGLTGEEMVRVLKRVPDEVRLAVIEELRATSRDGAPRTPQLRRRELAVLESGGIAVASHSLTHPCLSRCGEEKRRAEVTESMRILTEALGRPPRAFAYPDGDVDGPTARAVEEAGYEAAFLFDHRVGPIRPPDPLRISRVRVATTASLDRFATIVSGLHPAVHRARRLP